MNHEDNKEQNCTIAFRISPLMRDKLQVMSNHYNRSISSLVRLGIDIVISNADDIITETDDLVVEYERKRAQKLALYSSGLTINKKNMKMQK